jgi:hypothetical protein
MSTENNQSVIQGTTQSFAENYQKLSNASREIESMTVENIDQLISTVESASGAYRACIERIDLIEKHLGQLAQG